MTTLSDLARQYGVTPQAVSGWRDSAVEKYGDLPYQPVGKRKEYDSDAVAKIVEFSTVRPVRDDSQSVVKPDVKPVVIEAGNHSSVLALPNLDGRAYSLERFRDDSVTVLELEDPLAAVEQFLEHADCLIDGMNADISKRQQKLKRTQEAQERVSEKVEDLKAQARQYRRKSREISQQQNEGSTGLFEAMELLKGLGKSQAGNSPGASG